MESLTVIFGSLGAVLLLVAIVGGGFEFMGSKVPTVGHAARTAGFVLGPVLLIAAVGLFLVERMVIDPRPPGTDVTEPVVDRADQTPARGVVSAAGYPAYVYAQPTSLSTLVTILPDGAEVMIVCTVRGDPVTSPLTGFTSTLWDYTTLDGYVPDAFVDTGTNEPVRPACSS